MRNPLSIKGKRNSTNSSLVKQLSISLNILSWLQYKQRDHNHPHGAQYCS